jgi:hypothetical protein
MKHPANKSPSFSGAPGAADFLEDLIDACVMESGESMKSKGSGLNSLYLITLIKRLNQAKARICSAFWRTGFGGVAVESSQKVADADEDVGVPSRSFLRVFVP